MRDSTSRCRSLAAWYSAFSRKSPSSRARLISRGSSVFSSLSSGWISSSNFFRSRAFTRVMVAEKKRNNRLAMERISSRQNAIVKRFRDLARAARPVPGGADAPARRSRHRGPAGRRASRAGGARCATSPSRSPRSPTSRSTTSLSPAARIAKDVKKRGGRVVIVSDQVLAAMSPVQHPSGVVAIARARPADVRVVMATVTDLPLVLVLAGLQDPGNVGAIVRAAAAFGASGVVAIEGSANPFSWKALRGAMGGTFRLPIAARGSLSEVVASAHGARRAARRRRPARRHAAAGARSPRAHRHRSRRRRRRRPADDDGGRPRDGDDSDAAARRIAQRRDRGGAHPLRGDAPAAGASRRASGGGRDA